MYITKALITVFCVCMLILAPAEASVVTGTIKDNNLDMKYPIVYLDNNRIAQDKINSDIANYVYNFKNEYSQGKFYSGTYIYEVKYEDDKFISIFFIEMRYNFGAAHTQDTGYCATYDKSLGQKLPLPYFVKIVPTDLSYILSSPVYDNQDNLVRNAQGYIRNSQEAGTMKISTEYYLMGNGEIALVYPPYRLAPYSTGFTHFVLKADMIDYFNRKNP